MEEGNFCPIDAHTVSVEEKVKYEKMCNPQVIYESDEQFDDYSSDDSWCLSYGLCMSIIREQRQKSKIQNGHKTVIHVVS